MLQASPIGYELTDKVIGLCSNEYFGGQASQGFDIIIGDDELALNKASFATVRVRVKMKYRERRCIDLS